MVLRRGSPKIFRYQMELRTRLLAIPSPSQKNKWIENKPLYWQRNVRNRVAERVMNLGYLSQVTSSQNWV